VSACVKLAKQFKALTMELTNPDSKSRESLAFFFIAAPFFSLEIWQC